MKKPLVFAAMIFCLAVPGLSWAKGLMPSLPWSVYLYEIGRLPALRFCAHVLPVRPQFENPLGGAGTGIKHALQVSQKVGPDRLCADPEPSCTPSPLRADPGICVSHVPDQDPWCVHVGCPLCGSACHTAFTKASPKSSNLEEGSQGDVRGIPPGICPQPAHRNNPAKRACQGVVAYSGSWLRRHSGLQSAEGFSDEASILRRLVLAGTVARPTVTLKTECLVGSATAPTKKTARLFPLTSPGSGFLETTPPRPGLKQALVEGKGLHQVHHPCLALLSGSMAMSPTLSKGMTASAARTGRMEKRSANFPARGVIIPPVPHANPIMRLETMDLPFGAIS